MVTGESANEKGDKYYHIFVPTTPNPTSGYMLYVPQRDAHETNMTIEEGLKIIISFVLEKLKTAIQTMPSLCKTIPFTAYVF